jgi:hypothetical protein
LRENRGRLLNGYFLSKATDVAIGGHRVF